MPFLTRISNVNGRIRRTPVKTAKAPKISANPYRQSQNRTKPRFSRLRPRCERATNRPVCASHSCDQLFNQFSTVCRRALRSANSQCRNVEKNHQQHPRVMAFLRNLYKCSPNQRYATVFSNLQNTRICESHRAVKSTAADAVAQDNAGPTVGTPGKDPLDITFENPKAAFKSKTNWELIRALIVYQICSFEYLVENNMQVS